MNIQPESKPKKQIPFWAVLLIGVVITGIVSYFLTNVLLMGGFTPWESLPKPPSQIVRIIHADLNNVWVEIDDGRTFTLLLNCYNNENCYQWTKADNVPDLTEYNTFLGRGMDCASLSKGPFPLPPLGKVIECVKVLHSGAEWGTVIYFALMADGTLMTWSQTDSLIATEVIPALCTTAFSFFAAILISAIYLMRNIIKRMRTTPVIEVG